MSEGGWLEAPFALKGKKIWLAGHAGLVGSALLRRLRSEHCTLITRRSFELDCRDQAAVQDFISHARPDVVIVAAAKVGGIQANIDAPADFLYDNVMIASNIIQAAAKAKVQKLLYLGSSCIYPKNAEQPIKESAVLNGALEPSNAGYALAKIAGIKLCETYRKQYGCDFISAMPCNIYGPGDMYDEEKSHVIPALIMRSIKAKQRGDTTFEIWGTGKPQREFLYSDDLADGLVFLLKNYSGAEHINIGTGVDIPIQTLAEKVLRAVGLEAQILTNPSRPDGVMRKCLDVSKMTKAGWNAQTSIDDGLSQACAWYKDHILKNNAA